MKSQILNSIDILPIFVIHKDSRIHSNLLKLPLKNVDMTE